MRWGSDRMLAVIGAAMLALLAYWLPPVGSAQSKTPTIFGEWTLNASLSDRPVPEAGRQGEGGFGRGGRGGGRGGFGGGGLGGPRGAGGGGRSEDAERRLEELRNLLDAPKRLTVVSADSMVIITTDDGRTRRLAPDGSKVKDESTHTERRTHWEGATLVSELSGLESGTVTETYSVDADGKQLFVTIRTPAGREGREMVVHHVYDVHQ
jgi:hypothetical protein